MKESKNKSIFIITKDTNVNAILKRQYQIDKEKKGLTEHDTQVIKGKKQ